MTPLAPRVGGTCMQPTAVSRDDSTIAYWDLRDGPHEGIYVSRANGAGLHRVVQKGRVRRAFTERQEGRLHLRLPVAPLRHRYGRAGPSSTLGKGTDDRVDWSRDGKALLLTAEAPRFPRMAIVVRALSGSERVVVRGAWLGEARWSPDGRWIAYLRSHGEDRANGIYVVRPNGTGRHRVAQGSAFPYSWSRDGRRLAFRVGSKADFGIVGVDGRGLRRLRLRGAGGPRSTG